MNCVDEIKRRLLQTLSPDQIDIIDESHLHIGHAGAAEGAGHFRITVIADKFAGQSNVQRHRMVYAAVADLIPERIHALSIKALCRSEQ